MALATSTLGDTVIIEIQEGAPMTSRTVERSREQVKGFHNEPVFSFLSLLMQNDIVFFFVKMKDWFTKYVGDEESWLSNVRYYLGFIAGLALTVSFAAGVAPPGGFLSASVGDHIENAENGLNGTRVERGKDAFHSDIANSPTIYAGEAVLGAIYPSQFNRYLNWDDATVFLSLVILIVMMTGVPIKHKLTVWFCSMLLCLDLLAMGNTFTSIISLYTPNAVLMLDSQFRNIVIGIWVVSLYIIMAALTIRCGFWCMNKLTRRTLPVRV